MARSRPDPRVTVREWQGKAPIDGRRGTVASDPTVSYRRLRAAHLNEVAAALGDHVGRLDWSRDQIEYYQNRRLRELLTYAGQRSPFYAGRLADIDTASATVEDLAAIPMLSKEQAQSQWDEIITVPGLDHSGAELILAEQQWFSYTPSDQQIFSSGGSSGVRGVYVWDWQLFTSVACLAWRVQARAEHQSIRRSPARLAVLSAGGPPHASTPLFAVPTAPGMEIVVIPAGDPFDEVLAAVAEARPTHLVGYSTVIARLARATLAGALRIRPERVSTNSEPLSDEDRHAIRDAWRAPVHNLWGSTEIGVQAVGCGYGSGLHVCEDEVILERVDEHGYPVAPDAPAVRTLATGLANRTFPFIRYDLGDEVTWLPGRCSCGSAFARVADIDGRRDDNFRYGAVLVPASAFRYVLGTDPRINEYQVVQTARGAEVLVVGDPDVDTVRGAITAAIRHQGLADPQIAVRRVDRIPRSEATGKLKRFVALS